MDVISAYLYKILNKTNNICIPENFYPEVKKTGKVLKLLKAL